VNRSDHFSAEIDRCRKRTVAESATGQEKALRALFVASLPQGIPPALADEVFGIYIEGVLPGAQTDGAVFDGAERLAALCALFNGEFDLDAPDPFTTATWTAIGESVSASAEDLDMDILTTIMGVLLAKGALDGLPSGDDDDDDEEDDEGMGINS
jgi:hypothetical protein